MANKKDKPTNTSGIVKHTYSALNTLDVSTGKGIIKSQGNISTQCTLEHEIEWDGSFTQKRFHSGRTASCGGHYNRAKGNGAAPRHSHHGTRPHWPCCRSTRRESLIGLFRAYGGTVRTQTMLSGGQTTFIFQASIFQPERLPTSALSREYAAIVHEELMSVYRKYGQRDRHEPPGPGFRSHNVAVLNSTTMPAVLTESGFITNFNEAVLIMDDTYRRETASCFLDAIDKIYQLWRARR